jgi:hypothetical protein
MLTVSKVPSIRSKPAAVDQPTRSQHMITLNDCRAFCEVDPATVARVTRQEQLPEILAIACAQTRLMKTRLLHAPNPITLVPVACVPQRLAA